MLLLFLQGMTSLDKASFTLDMSVHFFVNNVERQSKIANVVLTCIFTSEQVSFRGCIFKSFACVFFQSLHYCILEDLEADSWVMRKSKRPSLQERKSEPPGFFSELTSFETN